MEQLIKKVTEEYKKQTGYVNLIGSIENNLTVLLPIIIKVIKDNENS